MFVENICSIFRYRNLTEVALRLICT